MRNRITILAALLLTIVFANAQTIKWMVEPEYVSITYYYDGIYKCTDENGKLQLIQAGHPMLPSNTVDAVTEFVNDYALALKGNKIIGFIEEEEPNLYHEVNGDYYVTEYPFFSEGLLVVADSKGKKGYMDTQGKIVIDCKYETARPFCQGRASVEPALKQVLYINPQGKTNNPDSFHGGKLTKGSSFNENGEAVVANYQDYAVIGTNMQVKKKISYTSNLPVRDCDYAYSEGAKECPRAKELVLDFDDGVSSFSEDGIYGYRWDNGVEIPAQFSEAQEFYANKAIVAIGGKYGIIESLNGSFNPNWPNDRIRVYEYLNETDPLQFTLSVPDKLWAKGIKLAFDKGDGRYVDCEGHGCDFSVPGQVIGRNEKQCTLKAKATYIDDGPELLLWEGTKELGIDYISIGLSNPATTSEYADEDDNQIVKAVVTNTSDVAVVVSATLTVGGKTVPFKGELKPKQSKPLTAIIKVDSDKTIQATISAKVDGHNCGSKTSTVSLKKI